MTTRDEVLLAALENRDWSEAGLITIEATIKGSVKQVNLQVLTDDDHGFIVRADPETPGVDGNALVTTPVISQDLDECVEQLRQRYIDWVQRDEKNKVCIEDAGVDPSEFGSDDHDIDDSVADIEEEEEEDEEEEADYSWLPVKTLSVVTTNKQIPVRIDVEFVQFGPETGRLEKVLCSSYFEFAYPEIGEDGLVVDENDEVVFDESHQFKYNLPVPVDRIMTGGDPQETTEREAQLSSFISLYEHWLNKPKTEWYNLGLFKTILKEFARVSRPWVADQIPTIIQNNERIKQNHKVQRLVMKAREGDQVAAQKLADMQRENQRQKVAAQHKQNQIVSVGKDLSRAEAAKFVENQNALMNRSQRRAEKRRKPKVK